MHLRRNGVLLLLCAVGLVTAYGCAPDNEDSAFPPVDVDAEAGDPGQFGTPDGMVLPEAGPSKPTCGNSAKDTGETCDDGNGAAGDGCSATCQIEPGWKCRPLGAACVATACGDGIVAGDEDCDDGNTAAAATAAARSVPLETGFKCAVPGKPCTPDRLRRRREGRHRAVRRRQRASVRRLLARLHARAEVRRRRTCTAVCGDGVKFPGEACDDGNTRNGDGCSATCTLEPGFTCTVVSVRTFRRRSTCPSSIATSSRRATRTSRATAAAVCQPGIVADHARGRRPPRSLSATHPQIDGRRRRSSTGTTTARASTDHRLEAHADEAAERLRTSTHNTDVLPARRPRLGQHRGAARTTSTSPASFVTASRSRAARSSTSAATTTSGSSSTASSRSTSAASTARRAAQRHARPGSNARTTLGLVVGGMYEIVVFQAERHTTQSNYKLTLAAS